MNLSINNEFRDFVENELLPGLELDANKFWRDLQVLLERLTPKNRGLLEIRDELQQKIDDYHRGRSGQSWDAVHYRNYLIDIGYLQNRGESFQIGTTNVDPEIAAVGGPQLVVPVNNARFALNAANARWCSLYDALYGTDVIPSCDGKAPGNSYNPKRGNAVIEYAAEFLDHAIPLTAGSHADVTDYRILTQSKGSVLRIILANGTETQLADVNHFIGFTGDASKRTILLKNNGLYVEIRIDVDHPVGKESPAGVCDIILEAAITTIQDCEDSVAAVDAADKVAVYRNWLGLMQGTLSATFRKGDRELTRHLKADREYIGAAGGTITLHGRSLMLVRNVGHLMTTDAILDGNGDEVFEGILDAVVTTACAMVDLRHLGKYTNSRAGSVYIVKPKMHGPDEAAFADLLFSGVEDLFGLKRNTIKIGVMDEERRTTVNLQECIRAVKDRLVFINTGFLDRTGDEIHTSIIAGPMLPKEAIKEAAWIQAYEDWNVDIGIRCGLPGKAQIGKGMWPKPDEMKQMVDTKLAHPEAGATCAWVPSPTAATLHAMHYHQVDVGVRQCEIAKRQLASEGDILTPPLCEASQLDDQTIQAELDNNSQGILGYVVRWIDQGVGCSKVPDIHDIGLMEDRATLRISSQHIANWLLHGICSEEQVLDTFRRMAKVVDEQNAGDPAYSNMAPDYDSSIAFKAACDLVLKGCEQPNGYTEPLLHAYRKDKKTNKAARSERNAD